jgi:hypothetical protein
MGKHLVRYILSIATLAIASSILITPAYFFSLWSFVYWFYSRDKVYREIHISLGRKPWQLLGTHLRIPLRLDNH